MAKTDTESEIQKLKDYLNGFNFQDDNLTRELDELKLIVSKVHGEVESALQFLVIRWTSRILGSQGKEDDVNYGALVMSLLDPYLLELDFFRFLKALKSQKLITAEECKKFVYLNELRRYFFHPNVFKKELDRFKDRKAYLRVLKNLSSIYNITVEIYDRNLPKSK